MKKKYLLLLLLFPLICAGQDKWLKKDQQELRNMVEKESRTKDYNFSMETDSVYSFLQQINLFSFSFWEMKNVRICDKPLGIEDIMRSGQLHFFCKEMLFRTSESIMLDIVFAEIAYKLVADTLNLTEPIDSWNVSRINPNYLATSSNMEWKQYYNAKADTVIAMQEYKKEKQRKIYLRGVDDSKDYMFYSYMPYIEMSIPVFDYSYSKAVIFMKYRSESFYALYERHYRNKKKEWTYIGLFSPKIGFTNDYRVALHGDYFKWLEEVRAKYEE